MTGSATRTIAMALLAAGAAAGASRPAAAQGSGASAAYPGRYPYTEADINFVTGMIGHHAQAIVMAGWAPTHGANKSVSILCERIINAQQDEITLMQSWLRDRKQPVPEAKAGPMKMKMNGAEMEMMMPGMLTDDQMKQLDKSRGPEFDRLFLTFMIQHHQGAITMVNELFASTGAGQDEFMYKFASDVFADQGTEIERMQKMLTSLPGKQ
jgi:uncharacterized protein (DUF305 family)